MLSVSTLLGRVLLLDEGCPLLSLCTAKQLKARVHLLLVLQILLLLLG